MNILLIIFELILKFLQFIFNLYYTPVKKLYRCLKNDFFDEPNNLLKLILQFIISSLMTFFTFNLFVFFIIRNYDSYSLSIFFGNLLRLTIIVLTSILFTYLGKFLNDSFSIVYYFFYSTIYLTTWFISLIFFILTGHPHYLDVILFRTNPSSISELLFLFFGNSLFFFERIIIIILTILHFINIFSIIRIICLFKYKTSNIKNVSYSFFLIFYDIFFLTPVYVFNLLFIWDFIEINRNICCNNNKDQNNSQNQDNLYEIIDREIKKKSYNILFIFGIIMTFISLIFLWRINTSFIILKDFYYHHSFKLFFIKFCLNVIDGILEIFISIEMIFNCLNIFNIKCLYDFRKNEKLSFGYKNLITFVQKTFDLIVTLFSFTRLITIPFWNSVIKKKCCLKYFYVLLNNDDIIEKYSNKNKRCILYKKIFINHILNLLIIFSFVLSIFNPFFFILTISILYGYTKFSTRDLISDNKTLIHKKKENNEYKSVYNKEDKVMNIDEEKENTEENNINIKEDNFENEKNENYIDESYFDNNDEVKNLKSNKEIIFNFDNSMIELLLNYLKNILYFYLIYFPLMILMLVLSFWTIKYPFKYLVLLNKNYCSNFKKIKESHKYLNESILKNIEINSQNDELGKQIVSLITGYKLFFEFVLIHFNIVRIFYFWYDVCHSKKTLRENIEHHFIYAIVEIPFLPFIIIFGIIEPWNFSNISLFFKFEVNKKLIQFLKIFKLFLLDLYVLFMFISLIVTLIDAIPCILLLIRNLKLKLFNREEDIINYYFHYKSDNFKTELRFLFYKHNRNILIFFLFIFDILLLIRTRNVIKRTKPFIKLFCSKSKNKILSIIYFFKCKSSNENNSESKLSNLSPYIISEISSYLDSKSVISLSLVNKQLNKKTETNVTWENVYQYYYKKEMQEKLDNNLRELFNPNMFSNYKKCCKKIQELFNEDIENKSKLRDKIIGFGRIVEEEAIVSIMLIPNLIFIPWKILSYIIYKITYLLHKFYLCIQENNYIYVPEIKEFDLTLNNFYGIHVQIFILILACFIYTIIFLFSIIINIYQWIIKILCCASLQLNSRNNATLKEKYQSLYFKNILQVNIGFIINLFHILIIYIPNIYYIYFYFDGLKPIKSFNDITDIFNSFFNFKLSGKLQIIFGIYGLSLVIWGLNFLFIFFLKNNIFQNSEIYFYSIIYRSQFNLFDKCGIPGSFLFPIPKICLFLNAGLMILTNQRLVCWGKKFSNFILNVLGFIMALFPFFLCYFAFDKNEIKKIITLFIPLCIYSVRNLQKMAKANDYEKNDVEADDIYDD